MHDNGQTPIEPENHAEQVGGARSAPDEAFRKPDGATPDPAGRMDDPAALDDPAGPMDPARPPNRRRRRRARYVAASAAALALVLAAVVGVVGVGLPGWRAHSHLQRAAHLLPKLQGELAAGELTTAKGTLTAAQREIRAARSETSGPMWRVASGSPKLGDDLAAVHTISAALDDLTRIALPPLLEVATGLETAVFASRDGRVDLGPLQSAAARLEHAATVMRSARNRVAGIRTPGLAPRLQAAITALDEVLDRADRLVGPAGGAARLAPAMLGADGPRTYLVLFQNLAEVRATGGMPGAFIVLQTDRGAITIADQGTAAGTLKTFDMPVLPLDEDLVDLHTERLGIFPADVNLTPDFPTAATLAREMYRIRSGRTVDGVIATDPVALSYLLQATGPVPVPSGEPLTAANAVKTLLSSVYATIPQADRQDAFFAGAARDIFNVLVTGRADPRAALAALVRASGERRLLMWSAHPHEQQQFEGTMLGGRMPIDDGAAPTVGVFLNDGSGAKLGYYLTHAATLAVGDCVEDGVVELKLKLTIGSTAPSSGLPRYVLGMGLSGEPYTVRTNVMVYSPTDGALVEATLDGAPADVGSGVERKRSVAVLTVDLPPGVTRTIEATLLTDVLPADGAAATTPRLWTTPGVNPWPVTVTSGPGCRK